MALNFREKMLPVIAKMRALNDAKFGLRPFTVYVRRSTPSDGRGGAGCTWTNVDVALPERPRLRQATTNDIVTSGGRIEICDMIMDLVTPQNAAGTVGTSPLLLHLQPDPAHPAQKVMLVLDGPELTPYVAGPPPSGGGEYTVVTTDSSGIFAFDYVLRPRSGRG